MCTFFSIGSNAQDSVDDETKTTSKFIGGNLFFSNEIRDKSESNNFFYQEIGVNLNPYYGIDFSNKFSAGIFASYDYQKFSFNISRSFQQEEYRINNTFGGGVFIRNYLNEGALRVFFESQVSFSRAREINRGPTIDELPRHQNILSIGVGPSVSYAINRLRLIANLGTLSYFNYSDKTYGLNNEKETYEQGYSTITLNFRPRFIGLGAEYLF